MQAYVLWRNSMPSLQSSTRVVQNVQNLDSSFKLLAVWRMLGIFGARLKK